MGVDVLGSIWQHINQLKPYVPSKAIICVGEYLTKILMKGDSFSKTNEVLPIFFGNSNADIVKWSEGVLDRCNTIGLDLHTYAHFWFNVLTNLSKDETFVMRLKDKMIHKLQGAILVSSTWDGLSSGLMPVLIYQLREWNINAVAIVVMPSVRQPLDARFNAASSLGRSLSKNAIPLIIVERDDLEKYMGVSRNGTKIIGNVVINEILELMLSRERLIEELAELSRSFNIRGYTVLTVIGASLEIYGSLKNILNSALLRPLLAFDLSNATVVYILLRFPLHLKDIFQKESIELIMAEWLKERANLRAVHVADPLYVKDLSDRIDITMFIGGFDTSKLLSSLVKEVDEIKDYAINQGFITKNEWEEIVRNLIGR